MNTKLPEEKIQEINKIYPIKISKHLESLMEYEPIQIQFYPQEIELKQSVGVGAYFPEEKHLTASLVNKYPNRCMIYTTGKCFAHCRHCSRKEEWRQNIVYSKYKFDEALNYIKNNSKFQDVILTGGDVLCNSDSDIEYMLKSLSEIDHVISIRLGTRAFTSNPSRITNELCSILKKFNKIIICTQFNSHIEFTDKTIQAIKMVQNCGLPILNQAVLLKGVNDNIESLTKLINACISNRVVPYYLFHCFKVKGVLHLRTKPDLGMTLTKQLVGNIGGWWIPRYVVIPDSTGIKVPLFPNGCLTKYDDKLKVQDFQNREIIYD